MTKKEIIDQLRIAFYTMAEVAGQDLPMPTGEDPEADDFAEELQDNYRWSEKKFEEAINALKNK